jgi:hypothetical protein
VYASRTNTCTWTLYDAGTLQRNYGDTNVGLLGKDHLSFRRRGSHISKQMNGLGKTVNLVISPDGPETKKNCAGEGQQQFTNMQDW